MNGKVTSMRVDPALWQAALDAAGGDAGRIEIVSEHEVQVVNRSRPAPLTPRRPPAPRGVAPVVFAPAEANGGGQWLTYRQAARVLRERGCQAEAVLSALDEAAEEGSSTSLSPLLVTFEDDHGYRVAEGAGR